MYNEFPFMVVMRAGRIADVFAYVETEEEARELCESYNWEYYDENDFRWSLYYRPNPLF